jgi:hypothetical protein
MIQSIIGTSFKGGFTTDFLIFGLKNLTEETSPDDYMLFNLESNNTITVFSTNGIFYGPTVFANNPNDGFKYFLSKDNFDPTNPMLFGKMDDFGNLTYLDIDILETIGGAIDDFRFTSVAGVDNTYNELTGIETGSGYGASFDIIVSGGTVSNVFTYNVGDLYKPGDTITISADNFGGTSSQSITITIDSVKASSSPTSMHYLGNNQFVCLDRFLFLDSQYNYNILPKTYMVDTFNQTITLLSVHSVDDDYYPTSLFEYNGYTWGVCTGVGGFPMSFIGRYDINAGVFNTELTNEVVINNIPGISMSKVWFIISAINVGGRIYCNLIVNDKETNNSLQCIAEVNVETGEADYLYSVVSIIDEGEYLYTNIINK